MHECSSRLKETLERDSRKMNPMVSFTHCSEPDGYGAGLIYTPNIHTDPEN